MEAMYTDLEYACLNAHRNGRSMCCGHFLTDNHPLMIANNVKRPVDRQVRCADLNRAEDREYDWQTA